MCIYLIKVYEVVWKSYLRIGRFVSILMNL
nr:MAG TPA: hypothetical protein [Caudoviricetes sp.]